MNTLHQHTVGLAVGATAAILHAVWAVVVALMPRVAQGLLNGNIVLHFLSVPVQIAPFTLGDAVMLVIVSFIVGYIVGCVFARAYNWAAHRAR